MPARADTALGDFADAASQLAAERKCIDHISTSLSSWAAGEAAACKGRGIFGVRPPPSI